MLGYCYVFDGMLRPFFTSNSPKSRITGLAGRVLGTFPGCMAGLHAFHGKRHVQLRAQGLAVPFKVVGCSLQAVMDMNGPDLTRPFLGAAHQQGG